MIAPESTTPVPCRASIIMLRHGQPSDVIPKSFLGHANPGLNDLGRQQAKAAAHWIDGLIGQGLCPAPSQLWSSDLLRASETARPLATQLDLSTQQHSDLREIDFGDWDGLTFADVDDQDQGAASGWFRDPISSKPPNGEHLTDVFQRVCSFAQGHLASLPSAQSVVVVGHFGSLAMLTAWLLDLQPAQALKIVLQRGQCGVIQAGHIRYWGFPNDW